MISRLLAVVVCINAVSADVFYWQGPGSNVDNPLSWEGTYPLEATPASVELSGEASLTQQMNGGSKIVLKAGSKLILSPGAKVSLTATGAGASVAKFIPGVFDVSQKGGPTDAKCHMNWLSGDNKVPLLKYPCQSDTGSITAASTGTTFAGVFSGANDFNILISNVDPLGFGNCVDNQYNAPGVSFRMNSCTRSNPTTCETSCMPTYDFKSEGFVQEMTVYENQEYKKKMVYVDGQGAVKDGFMVNVITPDQLISILESSGQPHKQFQKVNGEWQLKIDTTPFDGTTIQVTTPAATPAGQTTTPVGGGPVPTTPKVDDTTTKGDDDVTTTVEATTAGGDSNSAGSSGDNSSSDSTTLIIVIVIVVVVLLLAVLAAVVVLKRKGSSASDRSVVSFENPMYDEFSKGGAPAQQQQGGYQDVGPNSGGGFYADPEETGGSGYMDVAPGQQGESSGYMDVSPQEQGATGYMDVNPNAEDFVGEFDESDAEDV